MTKKDYERAARIVQGWAAIQHPPQQPAESAIEAFVQLFRDDNPRFDEARFRAACVPGANVRARPRKAS